MFCSGHLGWQQVDLHDVETSHSRHGVSYDLLQQENQTWNHKPLPEVCTVDDEEDPDPDVGQVGPVEHLEETNPTELMCALFNTKANRTSSCSQRAVLDSDLEVSTASYEGAGTDHHEEDQQLQDDSGKRRCPLHPADPRPCGQQVLPQTELTAHCHPG